MDIEKMRKQAEAGNIVDQTLIGCFYLYGEEGLEVDYTEALHWLTLAADQGASRAAASLGYMYTEGLGVPKDIDKAYPLLEAGIQTGEFVALLSFARIFARGEDGVPSNPAEAIIWYKELIDTYQTDDDTDVDILEALAYIAKHESKE
jgi:TPR repeat protein